MTMMIIITDEEVFMTIQLGVKMNNIELNKLVENAKALGHDVRIRDIAYVVLSNTFEDKEIAYASIFGNGIDIDVSVYENQPQIQYLRDEISVMNAQKTPTTKTNEDISFEENKAYMLKLKKDTENAMEAGEIDKKDGLKILTDISTKLNDKFQVSSEEKDQVIFVNCKYNSVCSSCGRELYIPTKEDLMVKYNLVENKK